VPVLVPVPVPVPVPIFGPMSVPVYVCPCLGVSVCLFVRERWICRWTWR